jgi:hypothetical protein
MREWSFKTIICPSRWQSTLGAMSSTKGNIVFSLLEKERNISYNKTRGHERQFDPFSK